jgi:hypothetical protein
MPPATSAGSGKDTVVDEVVLSLDRLEELVHVVTSDLRDIKAQQTALGVSLIRLEQQVPGSNDGASTAHVVNPQDSPPSGGGTTSIVPPHTGGRRKAMDDDVENTDEGELQHFAQD